MVASASHPGSRKLPVSRAGLQLKRRAKELGFEVTKKADAVAEPAVLDATPLSA